MDIDVTIEKVPGLGYFLRASWAPDAVGLPGVKGREVVFFGDNLLDASTFCRRTGARILYLQP